MLHLPDITVTESGREALGVARAVGLSLDPWQELSLQHGCSEATHPRGGSRWAAFEVGEIVGRQNGKGVVLEAREIAGCTLFGERILHSSHHFRTTRDAFERMLVTVENCPDLDRLVKKVTTANGNEGIVFRGGGRIQYIARERGAGRGLPPDVVVVDEAFHYPQRSHKALLPAMAARPNPQIWMASSAPDEDEHPHAVVLSRLRSRAISAIEGKTREPRLLWMEWSAADQSAFEEILKLPDEQVRAWLANRERWAVASPGLGYRLSEDFIADELIGLGVRGFAVERLSIGFWPNPDEHAAEGERPIDQLLWRSALDPNSVALDPVAISVEVGLDGTAAIAVQGWRSDHRKHGELIVAQHGTGWALPALTRIIERHDPAALVIDATGPTSALVPRLEAAGIEPIVITGRQRASADQALVNDLVEGAIKLRSCPALDRAAESTKWRTYGGQRAFAGGSIAAMRALSAAGLGLDLAAEPPQTTATPTPEAIRADDAAGYSRSDDLATIQF